MSMTAEKDLISLFLLSSIICICTIVVSLNTDRTYPGEMITELWLAYLPPFNENASEIG